MKHALRRVLLCFFSVSVLTGGFAHTLRAATVTWDILPDRERAKVALNNEESFAGQVSRIDAQGLLLNLGIPPAGVGRELPPAGAKLFRMAEPRGRAIGFFMRTPAFGYIVTRPDRNTVIVDVFSDPMGARWRPSREASGPGAAPAQARADSPGTQGAAAAPTAPVISSQERAAASPATPPSAGGAVPAVGDRVGTSPRVGESKPEGAARQGMPGETRQPNRPNRPDQPRQQTDQRNVPGQPEQSGGASLAPTREATAPPPAGERLSPAPGSNTTPSTRTTQGSRAGEEPAVDPAGHGSGGIAATAGQTPQAEAVTPQGNRRPLAAPPEPVLPMPSSNADSPRQAPGGQSPAQTARPLSPEVENPTPSALPEGVASPDALFPGTAPSGDAATGTAPFDEASAQQTPPAMQTDPFYDVPHAPGSAETPSAVNPASAVGGILVNEELPESSIPTDRPVSEEQARSGEAGVSHVFRSPLNFGDLNTWYDMQAVPGTVPDPAAARPTPLVQAPASPSSGEGEEDDADTTVQIGEKVIQYVDSEGNPVPPPPGADGLIEALQADIRSQSFDAAEEKVAELMRHPFLTLEQREEVLHLNADLMFAKYQNDLENNYEKIVSSALEAVNANPASPRNATELLRLGYVNLKTNNLNEAQAYFNMLRRQFPLDENIPLTYYYWGEYYYDRGDMLRAADQFQYVVQHYAESPYAREATLGLARSYAALGYFKQAFQVVEYLESRWPRFYLEYPPVLEMMGDVAYHLDNADYALNKYWTYVNLVPEDTAVNISLSRIGDIYAQLKDMPAAREVYNEVIKRYPDTDGALISMIRLAENGIYDEPGMVELHSVFDGPFNLAPVETYRKIIREYPKSPLAPIAQYKLAAWLVWDKDYEEAIKACSDLIAAYPDTEQASEAKKVALEAFSRRAEEAVRDNRLEELYTLWDTYPVLQQQEESLDPASRVALAQSFRNAGHLEKALEVLRPFFLGNKIPEYSEMALNMALGVYLEHELWHEIKDLNERIELWNLTPEGRVAMDYALALAYENLGESDNAVPLWQSLYDSGILDELKQAYAEFFLARDAQKRLDLQNAYVYAQSALNRFTALADQNPDQADADKMVSLLGALMDITENAGRLSEAQNYAERYMAALPENDPLRQSVLFRISQIHKKQGNTPEWRKTLTEISQNYPNSFYGRMAASELRGEGLAKEAARFSPNGQL